jgi:hypothetical protein
LADDGLVLRLDERSVAACPFRFAPRLRSPSRDHFGYTGGRQPPPVEVESPEIALSAVFLLRQEVQISAPRVMLLPQAQAFPELLAHAHCFNAHDPGHAQRLVNDYLAIVTRVPVFALQYRPDLGKLPQLIETVLEAVSSGSSQLRSIAPKS